MTQTALVSTSGPLRRQVALLCLGGLIAVIGSLCGVGGGIFAVPLLHYVFRLEMKASVATSLALVFATSAAATAGEYLHPRGELFALLSLALIVGSLLGAEVGHRLVRRCSTRGLKALFCVLLIFVGLRLIAALAGESMVPPAAQQGIQLTQADYLAAIVMGLCSGVLTPLLGIGGGLVVVPALLYFLPTIGFLGARAASLAMATVTTGRSLWIYQRQHAVAWSHGAPLALGALLGGSLGVRLVHLPGATIAGEAILGLTLLLSGTRFGIDYWHTRPVPPSANKA